MPYQFVFNVFVNTSVAFSRRILVTCNCHFIIVFTYCLGHLRLPYNLRPRRVYAFVVGVFCLVCFGTVQ